MSPVAHEARYYRARLDAHRAWAGSQPQYVIPGVLDGGLEEVDATRADGDGCGVSLLEPAPPSPSYLPGGSGSPSTERSQW